MTIRPEVLRALHDAGVPFEAILTAIEADKAAEKRELEAARAEKRAKDAERQRRHRAANVTQVTSVTRDERDPLEQKVPTPLKTQSPSIPPSPPSGAQTPTGVRRPGQTIPEDWEPKPKHVEAARAKGFSPAWLSEQAEAMREWAEGNSNRQVARKSNWDRAFDSWLRRAMSEPRARGSPNGLSRPFV
jgi:hypothetical protein